MNYTRGLKLENPQSAHPMCDLGYQKTFEVKDVDGHTVRLKVTPATEFEVERERPVKFSWFGAFSNIKSGSWVGVKYFGSTESKVAQDGPKDGVHFSVQRDTGRPTVIEPHS